MEKDSKYGDDVCRYRDKDGYYHVKPCEKGKYCLESLSSSTSYLEICHELPNIKALSNLKEKKCSTSFECEQNLECDGSSCGKCPASEFALESQGYNCISTTSQGSGYCSSTTLDASNIKTTKYSNPENYKKCGKLTIAEYPGTTDAGVYYIKTNEYDYIGTVEDGGYVEDQELCQSGFALYFYYDGKSEDPKPSSSASAENNEMYLRCVTPLAVHNIKTDSCSIYYKIKDGDPLNYNLDQLPNSEKNKLDYLCDSPYDTYIKIMSEKFREYNQKISEEERKTCGDLEGADKYTCGNNDLIKTWYFYKNPSKYILYNDREKLDKVLAYLIQKEYPNYSFTQFLNISIFSLLLFLFLF